MSAAVRAPCLCAALLLALAASCATSSERNETRFVEGALPQAGFRQVLPDTPARRDQLRALPQRRLTQAMRNGKVTYWYADLGGLWVRLGGGEPRPIGATTGSRRSATEASSGAADHCYAPSSRRSNCRRTRGSGRT